MGKITIALIAALLLSGCATKTVTEVQTVTVKVPVIYIPKPPTVERPELAIHTIRSAEPGEIAKAYAISVQQLIGYSEELEIIIDKYRVMSEEAKKESDGITGTEGSSNLE